MGLREWVLGILGLGLLMVVHEAGHLFAARSFGLRVTRFSIGFGPTIFRIEPLDGYFWFITAADQVKVRLFRHDEARHGPTVYQVAIIPFLAYVQVAGMNPLEEVDPEDKGSYANAPLIARVTTIFGGPLANYLFASVLFFGSLWLGGRLAPAEHPTEVNVIPDNPAMVAGLQTGDRIVAVEGAAVADWEAMAKAISSNPGKAIHVDVERAGQRLSIEVTPRDEKGKGLIGVRPNTRRIPVAFSEAARLSLERPALVVRDLAVGLYMIATRKAEPELAGPVGIVKETGRAARAGWTDLVEFLAVLSAYLGAFNLIPFPALDGGRLVFLSYEAATRKRAHAKIEALVHAAGLFVLLALVLYVTLAGDLARK